MSRASRPFPLRILLGVVALGLGVALATNVNRSSSPNVRDAEKGEPSTPALAELAAPASSPIVDAPPSAGSPSVAVAGKDFATPHRTPRKAEAVGTAGMMVGLSPETGRPGMPSREQREEIRNAAGAALQSPALDRSMEGLQVIHKPDGSRMIDLQGRFQEYSVVRIRPDGTKEHACVQGPDVEAALHGENEAAKASESTER